MNSISHLITVLLSIGSFLGLPYKHITYPTPTPLPGLTRTATSPIPSFSSLLPTAFSTGTAASIPSSTPPQLSKKQKLPTLVLKAPTFSTLPVAKEPVPATAPQVPSPSPSSPSPNTVIAPSSNPPPAAPVPATSTPSGLSPVSLQPSVSSIGKSIVNIFCTTKVGNTLTIITGSGVVVDPRGIILTNAHVADHVLQRDYQNNPNSDCFIRTGSPAVAAYKTSLIYISSAWLSQHGKNIDSPVQDQETGEGDYALLVTPSALNWLPVPSLPYLSPDLTTNFLHSASPLVAAGYGAGNLSGAAVMNNLMLKTDAPILTSTYSFHGNSIDLIRTSGSGVASRGSSGGAIVNQNGQLLGLIATTVPDPNGGSEDLQALTLSYINSDIQINTGKSLASFISDDLTSLINNFKQNRESTLFNYLPH